MDEGGAEIKRTALSTTTVEKLFMTFPEVVNVRMVLWYFNTDMNPSPCRRVICSIVTLLLVVLAACNQEPELGVVTVEVKTDQNNGRAQPVARANFRLLKGNFIDLLGGNSKDADAAKKLWDVVDYESRTPSERYTRVGQVFENHSIATAQTDAQGKLKFPPVLAGTYYVAGWTRVGEGNQLVIWNYEVKVKKDEEQNVVLNSANAATIAPYPSSAPRHQLQFAPGG